MAQEEDALERVLRIAELNSLDHAGHPWGGRSLDDLLELTDYAGVRTRLTEAHLAARLVHRPEIVERWVRWSEDKRTSDGYYLLRRDDRDWRVGRILQSGSERTFDDGAQACAAFFLSELDFSSQRAGEPF